MHVLLLCSMGCVEALFFLFCPVRYPSFFFMCWKVAPLKYPCDTYDHDDSA